MKRLAAALFAFALFSAVPAGAQGVVMVMRQTANGQTTTNQMQIDKSHVRADVGQQGRQMAVVYDADAHVLRMIDAGRKTYTEMTEAQIQQMGQQVAGAMAMMQEKLASLPPDQRKKIEEMMKAQGGMPGMPGAAAPARITYKRTGSAKVGQWACTTYDGFRGAEKVAEICAAEGKDIGLQPSDFEVVKKLAEFFSKLAPQAADQIATYGTQESQGFSGIPVRRTTFSGGKQVMVDELTELRREAIPSSTWEVPAGFKKETMPSR